MSALAISQPSSPLFSLRTHVVLAAVVIAALGFAASMLTPPGNPDDCHIDREMRTPSPQIIITKPASPSIVDIINGGCPGRVNYSVGDFKFR